MRRAITTAIAVATVLASGCGRSPITERDGAAGAAGAAGGGGAGGAGAGPATDAGSDRSSCVGACGMVTGLAVTSGCTFNVLCSPPPGSTGVAVFVDAQLVPRDSTLTEGWYYTDSSMSAFQLYGQACTAVLANSAPVDFVYLCEVALAPRRCSTSLSRCDLPASIRSHRTWASKGGSVRRRRRDPEPQSARGVAAPAGERDLAQEAARGGGRAIATELQIAAALDAGGAAGFAVDD